MTQEEYKENCNDRDLPTCKLCGDEADMGRSDYRDITHTVTGESERVQCCETCQEELAQGTLDGYELSE